MYDDGMVPRLLLLSLHRGDDVDHAFALGRDADLRPAVEVEVADDPRLLLLGRWWGGGEKVGNIADGAARETLISSKCDLCVS